MTITSFYSALAFLEQFANYEKTRTVKYAPDEFDLGRMAALLARLGDPHRQYKIVHVAGTKGKGSTCALIESALRAAGYRTGLYTSPHLHTFCERIQVNGCHISRDDVVVLVNELAPHTQAIPKLTWFEIVTALGLVHFARQNVEIAVVEVGLGGRLDATNVVTPLVSVITSLSFDHTAWLGDTLAQIAAEKAGIIKSGVPVVSAPQAPEAMRVIERRCAELGSPLTVVGRNWKFEPGAISLHGQHFWVTPYQRYHAPGAKPERLPLFVKLLGRHQLVNATLALATLAQLAQSDVGVSPRHMREGLASVQWPGRMEVLSEAPLLVCDGAHNGDSAQQLVAALKEWFPGKRWTLIFGASSDKDYGAMFDALGPFAGRIVLTRSNHPRAADPQALLAVLRERGGAAHIAADLDEAWALVEPETGVIVTGSLFVVAEARLWWARRSGVPLPETDD
jgi:dihydrofolate synthase/folylpolyglutamate synthase